MSNMDNEIKNFSNEFFRIDGKVAIVTGGNIGIGQALSYALASAGADLFIVDITTDTEETKKLIESLGRKVHFYQADLTKKETMPEIVAKCKEVYGKIDILLNNAGSIKRAPILEGTSEDWEFIIKINQNSVYYLSQEVARVMVQQGSGKIINIASLLAFQGGKFVPSYAASKHAVAGLTKAFANELANKNIQINAIAPGYIATANTAPIRADEQRNKEILSRIPAEEWGKTSDLMGAVVFLASPASNYVNGHILAVDGGWLAR